MTATPAYVDDLRRQQRAARHAASLTLAVHALAVVVLTVHRSVTTGSGFAEVTVLPGTYALLWLAAHVRGRVTGVGPGRDGFGRCALVALGFVAAVYVVPFAVLPLFFLGAGTFLGLGLLVLGVRARDPLVAVPGVVLAVTYPFVRLYTFDNHLGLLGPSPGTVVGGLLALGLGAAAVVAYRRERAELARPVAP